MTGIFHGNTEVLGLNVGGQEIAEVYVGSTKVWGGDTPPPVTNDFVMTIETTAPDETFTMVHTGFQQPPFDYIISSPTADQAGIDGQHVTSSTDPNRMLTFPDHTKSPHTITCSGAMPNVTFNNGGDVTKIRTVENLGVMGWATLQNGFYGANGMTSFVAGNTDTSAVTSMVSFLRNTPNLTTLDLTTLDTSSVGTMGSAFNNCGVPGVLDVSSFDTANVFTMLNMFKDAKNLTSIDLSSFSSDRVTNIASMFEGCSSLTLVDFGTMDMALVTTMNETFRSCPVLADAVGVEDFNISSLNATNSLSNFITTGGGLPTWRYDQLLINWEAQAPFANISANFGTSKYTRPSLAADARDSLTGLVSNDGYEWTVTDGGTV